MKLASVALALCALGRAAASGDHAAHATEFEWAGVFEVPKEGGVSADELIWAAGVTENDNCGTDAHACYVDPTMKIVVFGDLHGAHEDELHELEDTANKLMFSSDADTDCSATGRADSDDSSVTSVGTPSTSTMEYFACCPDIYPGDEMVADTEDGRCYTLHFDAARCHKKLVSDWTAIATADEVMEEGPHTATDVACLLNEAGTGCHADNLIGAGHDCAVFTAAEPFSLFHVDTSSAGEAIAFYGQHHPVEFEAANGLHYLLTEHIEAVEPAHELPPPAAKAEHEKKWGKVLFTTFLVNLATFCGIVTLAFGCLPSKISPTTQGALSGFASGALLGCALYLILIESSHMIAVGHIGENEVEVTWRWGTMVMLGFLTPLILFLFEPRKLFASTPKADTTKNSANPDEVEIALTSNQGSSTVFAVCIGDFAHNITDGFAIGIAFKACSDSVAWGIVMATIFHEIAQEIADFILLTSDKVGCSIVAALAFNFLAGTSVIMGGLIATEVDLSTETLGLILAYGGGTYVYLAASEALPIAVGYADNLKAQSFGAVKKHYAIVLFAFIIGAIAIGLILLDHEHCIEESDDPDAADPHAGHNHG